MPSKTVRLTVPAEPEFARIVRMTAANLAVCCDMPIDDVEDARMAAEEGFVYACATVQNDCDISFTIDDGQVSMTFSLGLELKEEDEDSSLDLVEALLGAICDESQVSDDETQLTLIKRTGGLYAE